MDVQHRRGRHDPQDPRQRPCGAPTRDPPQPGHADDAPPVHLRQVGGIAGPGLEERVDVLHCVEAELLAGEGAERVFTAKSSLAGAMAAEVVDVIQIPAFLVRQTRLVAAAARTGKVVNLKKSQMLSPEEMGNAVEKARVSGAGGVLITERGTSFGYNNLVVDFTAFPRMRAFGAPLIFDATHSLQLPGGLGKRSGGRPEFVATLSRAAAAAGCDGIFIETHFAPLGCRCDAEAMLSLDRLPRLLAELGSIFRLVRSFGA